MNFLSNWILFQKTSALRAELFRIFGVRVQYRKIFARLRRDFPLFSVPDPKFSRAYGAIFRYLVYQIQNFRAPTAWIPLFSVPESKICARLRRDFRLYTVHKSKMFARAYGRLDIHNVV